jgi:hypothetical protein
VRSTICCGTPDRIDLIGSDTLKVVVEPRAQVATNQAVGALSFLSVPGPKAHASSRGLFPKPAG